MRTSLKLGEEIVADSNFKKLPKIAEEFNRCLKKETDTTQCSGFIAKNDDIISGIEAVHQILPEFAKLTRDYKPFKWETTKGKSSGAPEQPLYILAGSGQDKQGNAGYVFYRFVQQNDELKIYGIYFSTTPPAIEIPVGPKSATPPVGFSQVNGIIKTDPNFAKLSAFAESVNQCLKKEMPTACERFLAKDDELILEMEPVRGILPQLPTIVRSFGDIQWEQPRGAVTKYPNRNLYVIVGSTQMKNGKKMYVRYRMVNQSELKLYGIYFSPDPLANDIPIFDRQSGKQTEVY
ncbi:MAG: hypothetical protein HYU97_01570 [Deltaproteobacteria bacterium]|nr:hypothetical protein [Deltaproteobacteria bacterium]